jgi:geranylgeranyl diphosphate synthase, type III
MLHNASLLYVSGPHYGILLTAFSIDDIQDDSKLRRGEPVAHLVFGVAQTINSANYTYFQAMEELYKLKDPIPALKIFNEEMLNLHRGQGMDLFWRDTLTLPTEDDYLKMVSNKTGGLFRLALRLMMAASPTSHDLLPLSEIIGRLFQIQDDYRNLCSEDVRYVSCGNMSLTKLVQHCQGLL